MASIKNFIVIVALICALGNSAAEVCNKDDGQEDTCDTTKPNCALDIKTGKGGGCVEATECPEGLNDAKVVCKEGKCCCQAGVTACNDISMESVKKQACELPELKPEPWCAGGPTEPDTATKGPGGDGDKETATKPADETRKCFKDDNNSTETCEGDAVNCQLMRKGDTLTPAGCSSEEHCPISSITEEFFCHDNKCCCKGHAIPCNDKDSIDVKDALERAKNSGGSITSGSAIILAFSILFGLSVIFN